MLTGRGPCERHCWTTASKSCRCVSCLILLPLTTDTNRAGFGQAAWRSLSRSLCSWSCEAPFPVLLPISEQACCRRRSCYSINFGKLQALGNVLVVAPTALLGLVDGSLRISHSAALKFIRLREDFKSARLSGGISLAQAFAED